MDFSRHVNEDDLLLSANTEHNGAFTAASYTEDQWRFPMKRGFILTIIAFMFILLFVHFTTTH